MFRSDRHRIVNCDIGTRDILDHSPIYLQLHLDTRPKQTIWRLNTSLLHNKSVVQQIKSEIKTFLELNNNGEVNTNILWDTLKAVIRGKFISLSSVIKKEREGNLRRLENE